jgi:hypothetical protein
MPNRHQFIKRKIIEVSSRAVEKHLRTPQIRIVDNGEFRSQRKALDGFCPLKNLLIESFERLEELSKSDGHSWWATNRYPELDMKL